MTAPSTRPDAQSASHTYSVPAISQPSQPPAQQQQRLPQQTYQYTQNYAQSQHSTMVPTPQYTPPVGSGIDKGKERTPSGPTLNLSSIAASVSAMPMRFPTHQQQPHTVLALGQGSLSIPGTSQSNMRPAQVGTATMGATQHGAGAGAGQDDEDDADELPAMSDDVYGQGLLWQSQSKDNLKVLMDNFTPEQFERYEAYRRSALPKQSIRKVIQQSTNYTVSQPVAQIVAGFAKVFVGEIVEKARAVQARMGESSEAPLSPEHLREAYRLYQQETGNVGAARVHRGKKLFVR